MDRHLRRAAYLNIAFYSAVVLSLLNSYINRPDTMAANTALALFGYNLFLYIPYFIYLIDLLDKKVGLDL